MARSIYAELERDRLEARQAWLEAARREAELERVRDQLATLQLELALLRVERAFALKYRPDQPRVPAGNPDGGQWTPGGDAAETGADVVATGSTSRPSGSFHPGRHHCVPQSIYNRLALSPETRRVFDEAVTGRLQAGTHQWSQAHRAYNLSVGEQLDRFMLERGIRPEQMTPDDARRFVSEVNRSNDPRIRGFNLRLYRREMLYA